MGSCSYVARIPRFVRCPGSSQGVWCQGCCSWGKRPRWRAYFYWNGEMKKRARYIPSPLSFYTFYVDSSALQLSPDPPNFFPLPSPVRPPTAVSFFHRASSCVLGFALTLCSLHHQPQLTIFIWFNVTAFIKFFLIQVRYLFEGSIYRRVAFI